MNGRPSEGHLSHLPTLAFLLVLNGKTLGRLLPPPLVLTLLKNNITSQPISRQQQTLKQTEGKEADSNTKWKPKKRANWAKAFSWTFQDVLKTHSAQLHDDGYGRIEVLLLDSARIHSSVCFNSLRTSFSRSLLDFNSSSRHCFILLFSCFSSLTSSFKA